MEFEMKYEITYVQENCSGCLRCQLACSRAYAKSFQPSAARIKIEALGAEYRVAFTEDCVECGFCADNCLFGALTKIPKEVAA